MTLQGIGVLLSVTKLGGEVEANALLDGSLSTEQVRSTVSAGLSLGEGDLFVDVQQPIFPPMPPPSLPPSPPSRARGDNTCCEVRAREQHLL